MLIPAAGSTTADTIATLARGVDTTQPLTFVEHYRDDDAYTRGPVLFVVPGLWDGMSPDLLAAVRDRRACDVTGQCPRCGVCLDLAATTWRHEPRCPVADDQLRPALTRWGRRVGQFARGRRIRETPGAAA